MSATIETAFKRNVLQDGSREKVATALQSSLETLIDLALILKQAHWNVVGSNFRSVHLQLDEIIVSVRAATDDIAERIVTIGASPDGRAPTVAAGTKLETFPAGLHDVSATITLVADRLNTANGQLRGAIDLCNKHDPVSEDLLIGICAQLEKHLWMVQAQEISR